ncbi:uncharacterized protein LOC112559654 [Pomacea canaliculata]|uniref:uncharacterized protein LOC112559654 n=1 Tax=Pomacea canaliculata TaxID=400727 RepID=UPI000D73AF40|nr:uncharacterized protein LOC112559654 [Pomacea canaliculata]
MEDIVYGSVTLNQTVQDKTSSSQFVYPDYAVVKRNVASTSILSGQRDIAAYIQLQSPDGVVLSPLAAGFSIINILQDCNSTTPSEAGDTVDNDCDGKVDEDDCSGTPTGTDCKLTISVIAQCTEVIVA